MAKTRVLPIILAAMLSVCANTAVFPATAYVAEPAVEADVRKAEEQFEDEDQQETEDNQETEDHQETEGQPETGDQQKTEDQPIEVAETAEQPVTAEQSETTAQQTEAEQLEITAQQTGAEHLDETAADEPAPTNVPAQTPSSSVEEHHLAFASDYHNTEGGIRNAMEGLPEDVEYVSLIGREARKNESCRKKRS